MGALAALEGSIMKDHSLNETNFNGAVSMQRRRPQQQEPPADEQPGLLEEYLATFKRHRRLILLGAIVGSLLSMLVSLRSLPVYRTRTSLDIRSLNNDFMNARSVDPTGDGSADETSTNLQTQIRLLQSDTLLDQVTARLMKEPHASGIQRQDALSRIERQLHLGGKSLVPYASMVQDAATRVKVKPLGLTRLVEISCDSWDAQFSAKFCNTVTSTFEEQDLQTRSDEANKTSEWLTRQVADVRQKAEESQKKLEAAVGGNGLMLSQTTTSAGEDRLRSLQEELVKAQADRMEKQAVSTVAQGASPDTLPEVQDNPAHRVYELRLADLNSQIAALVPRLTEQNPKVILLRAQIADARAGLLATQSNSTGRQGNELSAARHREELLQVAFNAQQSTVSSDLQKAAQVSLLRRELDSEQQLYQTLLQRAKEAGFASAMQAATIRVVDIARVPRLAISPQRKFEGILGLALGALFSTLYAFYKDRHNKVFRLPGDVERFLHVEELGVIPAIAHTASSRGSAHSAEAHRTGTPRLALSSQGEAISLTRWTDNFSIAAEAYRNATLSILLSDSSKRPRSYVVSSPNAGEGKTTVTSNLGVALSKSKLRVALIDGDLRRPNLHNAFGMSNRFGLRNILRGEVNLETTPTDLLAHPSDIPNISVIAAGSGHEDVVELLHSPFFATLLARLSHDFDIVLIDSPPVLHMADARILAGQSDGAVLILRAGMTTREQATRARDLLDHDGVRLVGTILNDFDPVSEGKPNYYESYYRYQHQQEVPVEVGAGV